MLRLFFCAILIFSLVTAAVPRASGQAQTQQSASQVQGAYTQAAGDDLWPDDLSAKVDKTIKVLTVIKGELQKTEAADKAAAAKIQKLPADEQWIERLRGKLSALIRMWKKTEKVMQEGKEAAKPATGYTTAAGMDAKAIDHKIDTVIKAMEVIKEELKAIDEEEKGTKK